MDYKYKHKHLTILLDMLLLLTSILPSSTSSRARTHLWRCNFSSLHMHLSPNGISVTIKCTSHNQNVHACDALLYACVVLCWLLLCEGEEGDLLSCCLGNFGVGNDKTAKWTQPYALHNYSLPLQLSINDSTSALQRLSLETIKRSPVRWKALCAPTTLAMEFRQL